MHSLPNADTGIDELAFYKQLAVLQCLHFLEADQYYRINRERGLSQPPRVLPEDPTDSTSQQEDPDIKLRKFLDCLAEVCASTRNGDTVTAVTVHLPSPGLPPEYVFVSNHLSQKAVSNAKDYIEGILNAFGQLQEYPSLSQSQEVAQTHIGKEVLRQAVCFDRKRLHYYLRKIKKNLEVLSKRSELDTFLKARMPTEPEIDRLLRSIEGILETYKEGNKEQSVDLAMVFIQHLKTQEELRLDGIFGFLNILVEEGKCVEGMKGLNKEHSSVLCHKIQHALKRILLLRGAVEVFARTARDWPQLFQRPTVRFLESESRERYGIKKFDESEIEQFLESLKLCESTMQLAKMKPGLGDRVQEVIQKNSNGRQAHAELQLWSYIQGLQAFLPFRPESSHGNEASESQRIVIGVSKMTCRLCHWFFMEVGWHKVAIRPSSLNVYHRWALPSLPCSSDILSTLSQKLAEELSRVLRGGCIQRTETDTDSEPNTPVCWISSDDSSNYASNSNISGIWSDGELDTSSIGSYRDPRKADS